MPTDDPERTLAPVPTAADLLADTTLTPDASVDGRYHSSIPVAWQIRYAFGGVTMMTALRAAETALSRPDLRPLTASALFCAPVPCGPVVTDTTLLHRRPGHDARQHDARRDVPERLVVVRHGDHAERRGDHARRHQADRLLGPRREPAQEAHHRSSTFVSASTALWPPRP